MVAKAEYLAKGANPRFVVTSLRAEQAPAQQLYETIYCARGEMENRIEQQLGLFADRTSTAKNFPSGDQLRPEKNVRPQSVDFPPTYGSSNTSRPLGWNQEYTAASLGADGGKQFGCRQGTTRDGCPRRGSWSAARVFRRRPV